MSALKNPRQIKPMIYLMVASALLSLLSIVFFFWASQNKPQPLRRDQHKIAIGKNACEPNSLTVSAGENHFEITNQSERTVEWEILDGVMVVAERENIAPGFHTSLTANLKPGIYAITCGLLTNPRGVLTVIPTEASAQAKPQALSPLAFLGPLSEYKMRLMLGADTLLQQAQSLEQAIARGDLSAAQNDYRRLRLTYKKLEPVMVVFADLENLIDPPTAYLEKQHQDKAFTGFPALAHGLFTQNTTVNLAPLAKNLTANISTLQQRIKLANFAPGDILDQAAREARRSADALTQDGSTDQSQAGAELATTIATLASSFALLQPLLAERNPDLSQKITADFAGLTTMLAPYETSGKSPPPLTPKSTADLARALNTVSNDLDQANLSLGGKP